MRRTAIVAALAVAVFGVGACGKSPEDEARKDGKQVGEAVRELRDAESLDQAKAAVGDLRKAVGELGEDARDAVSSQVETQSNTLSDAAEALGSGDLDGVKEGAQEIRSQAEAFKHGNNSVANEFWRGFEEGYDG